MIKKFDFTKTLDGFRDSETNFVFQAAISTTAGDEVASNHEQ